MKPSSNMLTTVIATVLVATSTACASLIGHFTFDNPGSIGADSSGFANHAGSLNSVGYTATGISGGAATFTASAHSCLRWTGIADAIANSVGSDFSFSVWVKSTQRFGLDTSPGYEGAGIIYSDVAGPHNDTIPIALTGNNAAFETGDPSISTGDTIHSTTAINTGIFTHVVVTRELSTGNKTIYVNGVPEASTVHRPGVSLNERHEIVVGGNVIDSRYFDGTLDDLQVYNQVLISGEILYLYEHPGHTLQEPHAATATATVVSGSVLGATLTDHGWGYTNTPAVRIIGGGGSGAEAVAVVSNGVVIAVNVINEGYGYMNTPIIVVDPPFNPNPVLDIAHMSFLSFSNLTLGGVYQLQQVVSWYWSNQPVSFTATKTLYTRMAAGVAGSGDYRLALNPAPAQAFATATVSYGFVVHATLTSGGSGYIITPAVDIVGGGGSNATATAQISGGVVTNITITSNGTGYTNTPTVRIAPPPAAAIYPTVLPVMRVDSVDLAPYRNYQIQFRPDVSGAWENWNGGLFSPISVTNSQYLFITNDVGFFRLQYLP